MYNRMYIAPTPFRCRNCLIWRFSAGGFDGRGAGYDTSMEQAIEPDGGQEEVGDAAVELLAGLTAVSYTHLTLPTN